MFISIFPFLKIYTVNLVEIFPETFHLFSIWFILSIYFGLVRNKIENEVGVLFERVNMQLLQHQIEGLQKLKLMETKGKGGILADEMGLGKTIQMLV